MQSFTNFSLPELGQSTSLVLLFVAPALNILHDIFESRQIPKNLVYVRKSVGLTSPFLPNKIKVGGGIKVQYLAPLTCKIIAVAS